jgi:isopropylmalate/homocitrate/citramalate synthase
MIRKQPKVPGKYEVSPYNFADEVVSQYDFPEKLPICDATIRKIDNTPGSLLPTSVEDKLEICALLDDMGVAEVGCNPMHFHGTPRHDAICDGIRAIAKGGFKFKLTGVVNWNSWTHGHALFREHADRIIDMGLDVLDVEGMGSEFFHETYLGDWGWEELVENVAKAVDYVRSKGVQTGVAPSDIGRGNLDQMIPRMNTWIDAGATRFMLADSFGSLSPPGTQYMIRTLRKGINDKAQILYHPHDDFGLATAMALAAASAGAWPEASTNGIGERAYLKLEEYVLSLELLYGVDTGIKLEKLTELCNLVERVTGIKNPPHKPVVGQTMYVPLFEDEYTHMLKGGSYISTAFVPELVGQKAALVWWEGMMSPSTVRAKLDQMGLEPTEAQVNVAIGAIRAQLQKLKEFPAWIQDEEVSEICRRALA